MQPIKCNNVAKYGVQKLAAQDLDNGFSFSNSVSGSYTIFHLITLGNWSNWGQYLAIFRLKMRKSHFLAEKWPKNQKSAPNVF